MTNTTTQSGQRPPITTRPTDAELARLLRDFAELRDDWSNGKSSDWDDYTERLRTMADALEDQHRADYCADCDQPNRDCACAPARLTPEQWQEAVERAATKMFDGGFLSEIPPSVLQAETEMDICRIVANLSIRAAFPHLAPNPED